MRSETSFIFLNGKLSENASRFEIFFLYIEVIHKAVRYTFALEEMWSDSQKKRRNQTLDPNLSLSVFIHNSRGNAKTVLTVYCINLIQ